MFPLIKLIEFGQSYWLDNLTRAMIKNGELEKRVNEEGLRGITSNPKTFSASITHGNEYDEQFERLAKQKYAVQQIYEAMAVRDVQDACDILRPVYKESEGLDGFVSLEVSPHLAHHTEATMNEVRRLARAVNRPNCFIKIPGTEAGIPAIEQMLYEGINVNITLLFSIDRYEEVARAYIRALERRKQEGKSIAKITSVASFFLSRIDVLVDQLLDHRILPGQKDSESGLPKQLLGKTAIASAKIAYQRFKQIFNDDRWDALAADGAKLQRPLWASTSTKNPSYSDVRYVEPLIGPDTVNTMPEQTIKAVGDHGVLRENTIEQDLDEAQRILSDLSKAGINLDNVTWQLENEGVQKFIDPYDELLEKLTEKR